MPPCSATKSATSPRAIRHGGSRRRSSNQMLGVLGQVLSGVLLGDRCARHSSASRLPAGPQLATLSYSRSQELEADELGIELSQARRLRSARHGDRAAEPCRAELARCAIAGARCDDPRMGLDPPRSGQPGAERAATGAAADAGGVTNRDTFLTRIDGLLYGDDPKQGVIEGRQLHPPGTAPDLHRAAGLLHGQRHQRGVDQRRQRGKAQFTPAPYNGNLDDLCQRRFQALGGDQTDSGAAVDPAHHGQRHSRGLWHGAGQQRPAEGRRGGLAYEFSNNRALPLRGDHPGRAGGRVQSRCSSRCGGSARQRLQQVVPRRIDVVTAQRGDTVAIAGAPDGLQRCAGGTLPGAERPVGSEQVDAGAEGTRSWFARR